MRITEDVLKENLKLNKLSNLYYFYGKEDFLVRTYTDRVRERFTPEPDEFNIIKLSGCPGFDSFEEAIETLPVFAEKKVVLINDFDAEKTDPDTLDRIIALLSDIPEYCLVLISITGFELGKNTKTKKLITAIEKYGIVCEFDFLGKPKAAELIIKKASRAGCIIARWDAEYIYDLTLGSLTLISSEVEKLCAYAGAGGEITRQVIDRLTPRLTETSVYELAASLTERRAQNAFNILDDLMAQNVQPVIILSSLSGAFTDYYRAKLGKNYKQNPDKAAADFNYPKNRAWLMKKVPASDLLKIKKCISLLYKADIKLKSTTLNNRTVIEKTITEILTL